MTSLLKTGRMLGRVQSISRDTKFMLGGRLYGCVKGGLEVYPKE